MAFVALHPRVWVVIGLLFLFALARRLWRQWRTARRHRTAPRRAGAELPPAVVGGARRTWAVFTTPWCASCGPVADQLREAEPDSRVIVLDATEHVALASRLGVRSAPTVMLAGADGRVVLHLVGADAVRHHLGNGLPARP